MNFRRRSRRNTFCAAIVRDQLFILDLVHIGCTPLFMMDNFASLMPSVMIQLSFKFKLILVILSVLIQSAFTEFREKKYPLIA